MTEDEAMLTRCGWTPKVPTFVRETRKGRLIHITSGDNIHIHIDCENLLTAMGIADHLATTLFGGWRSVEPPPRSSHQSLPPSRDQSDCD